MYLYKAPPFVCVRAPLIGQKNLTTSHDVIAASLFAPAHLKGTIL